MTPTTVCVCFLNETFWWSPNRLASFCTRMKMCVAKTTLTQNSWGHSVDNVFRNDVGENFVFRQHCGGSAAIAPAANLTRRNYTLWTNESHLRIQWKFYLLTKKYCCLNMVFRARVCVCPLPPTFFPEKFSFSCSLLLFLIHDYAKWWRSENESDFSSSNEQIDGGIWNCRKSSRNFTCVENWGIDHGSVELCARHDIGYTAIRKMLN